MYGVVGYVYILRSLILIIVLAVIIVIVIAAVVVVVVGLGIVYMVLVVVLIFIFVVLLYPMNIMLSSIINNILLVSCFIVLSLLYLLYC